MTVTRGVLSTGDSPELAFNDDMDVSIFRSNADIQSRTEFVAKGTSMFPAPSSIEITLEGSVFARSAVNQTLEIFDYQAGQWDELDVRAASRFTDSGFTVSVTDPDLSKYVEPGTNCVEARVRFESPAPRQRFASNTDHLIWVISQ